MVSLLLLKALFDIIESNNGIEWGREKISVFFLRFFC